MDASPLPCTPVRRIKNHLHKVMATTPAGKTLPAVHIPPTPFLKRIGYGTGVDVFLYERSPAKNGKPFSPWALKRVNKKRATEDSDIAHRLELEAEVLRRLNHPNIIGYRGYKLLENGNRVLAMEDGHQSLMDLIEERNDTTDPQPFPANNIKSVVLAVTKALTYLHRDMRLLHGDLKSGNILVKKDFEEIKLCDFGVTIPLDKDGIALDGYEYIGTNLWSAPEVLDGGNATEKSDVFSLGLIIYEMISLSFPHMNREDEDSSFAESEDSFVDEEEIALGTRPHLPAYFDYDDSYTFILELYFAMTQEDPRKRPNAGETLALMGVN